MSTKVEPASTVEQHRVQTIITANTSAASASSPKISMFAAKSGFVIPKNKLSGSLVPIFRGGKKPGGSDAVNEESTKQVQRKTKWGPDLTQDAAVRKGRAVAYQTRVDQITKRLNSGILETRDNQDSPLSAPIPNHESSVQIKSEKSESLELERREAIGEILKLNPSYKAPKDYKPLLKEAKVSVPETGAKVRVYGTKADTGEKGEITPSDGNEALVAYAELYVHISADTYEKVDAAVSLIELLVTPVPVNPSAVSTTSTSVSADNVNAVDQSQGTSTPYIISAVEVNQKAAQSFMGSVQTPQVQFQPHPGPWFPAGPPQSPMRLPSGFIFPPNPSAPMLNNLFQASSSSFNPSHMPSLFGPRPVLPAGLGSVPQNPSLVPSRAQPPVLQRPFMPQAPFGHAGSPRNPPMAASQPSPAQPSISAPPPPPHTGNQPPSIVRSLGPSSSQPVSTRPSSGSLPDRMLPPAGSSTQWSQALSATPPSLRPGSMSQMAPPVVPQGPHPVTPQPIIASGPPLYNITTVNMVSPVAFPPRRPSGPEPYITSGNRPPVFTSGPQPPQAWLPPASSSFVPNQLSAPMSAPRPIQSPSPVASMQLIIAQGGPVTPNPIPNPLLGGSMPIALQVASTSTSTPPPPPQAGIPSSALGSAPTFAPIKPPSLTAPKPQHPNSSDFTFQPHRPQNLITQAVPRPGIQPTIQNMRPPNPTAQLPMAPQTPSFRPAIQTSSPPVMQGIPRPPLNNQMNQTHSQVSSFAGNPTITTAPPRHPSFPNPNSSLVPQMGHRKLNPSPHVGNMGGGPGPFPRRPGNPVQQQLQQNYLSAVGRPQSHLAPNQQQLGSNLPSASSSGRPAAASSSPGAQQNYDPFSPTSISTVPLQGQGQGGNPLKTRKQESDPEYDDLMASVGVK
ncbi:extensin isoform X2 [Camellia sinensis]|uniref:extensin isoform X2 n=1 Tax=Camellia sinensis TaxID=4442 RepID=UPI001035C1DF|nr:extensin isoform X2 [Camellia sinensis]